MIAEIHNKISASGSNLHDRREDLLTGDVFGSLRYLPFHKGYLPVLRQTTFRSPDDQKHWLDILEQYNCENTHIKFWEQLDGREIDLLIYGPDNSIIGCEVKYLSWLSSDDDVSNEDEDLIQENYQRSINQLSDYAHMLAERSDKSFLILVAPRNTGDYIIDDVIRRNIMPKPPKTVRLGLLLWESMYPIFRDAYASANNCSERFLFQDLVKLLEKRNLQTFGGWGTFTEMSDVSYQYQSRIVQFNWEFDDVKGDMSYEFKTRDR